MRGSLNKSFAKVAVSLSKGMPLLAVAILWACTSAPVVKTNTDPGVDLHAYKTFGFMQPLGTDKAGYTSLVTQQLKTSARREMERLGYSYKEQDPDLLLNFSAKLADKLLVYQTPVYGGYGGYYGYRSGYYGAWPAYSTSVDQYKEGTLNVDLVDSRRRALVWEGVAVARVTSKDEQQIGPLIDSTVVALFAKFPP